MKKILTAKQRVLAKWPKAYAYFSPIHKRWDIHGAIALQTLGETPQQAWQEAAETMISTRQFEQIGHSNDSAPAILWKNEGPNRIRGYINQPKTTLFFIERNPKKPHRGRLSGAVIPDKEDGKGKNVNALISWLQGFAAPQYLRQFLGRSAQCSQDSQMHQKRKPKKNKDTRRLNWIIDHHNPFSEARPQPAHGRKAVRRAIDDAIKINP